ncbi:MAG: hypothetical protein KGI84_08745 [Elusimicrobia bacterium]|nr:hypothetical protein [Elusimicrobiota bacterium]
MKKFKAAARLAAAVCAAAALAAPAMAQNDWSAPLAKPPSFYSQLQSYFKEGFPAKRYDVSGWHSGRCYGAAAPNTPYARLLLGGYAVDDSNGSLFPSHRVPQFFLEAWAQSTAPAAGDLPSDRYDRLSPADAAAAQSRMKQLRDHYLGPVRGAVVDGAALVSSQDGNTYAARAYDQEVGMPNQGGDPTVRYIIVRISGTAGAPLGSDVMCYFSSPDIEPSH